MHFTTSVLLKDEIIIMNTSKHFLAHVQENIIPLLILSAFQILITIEFPGYSFLDSTGNAIMKPIFGVVGMLAIWWLFTTSRPLKLGTFPIIVSTLGGCIGMYYMCHKGFFNYSQSFCLISCVYMCFMFACIYVLMQKRIKT